MSQILERIKMLIDKLDNEKNSELFPICVSQIALLYSQSPSELHVLVFNTLKRLIVSKQPFKRALGASLFEKVTDQLIAHQTDDSFIFNEELLKFNMVEFIESLDKSKRDKNKPDNNLEQFAALDLLSATPDSVTKFFSKKDNYLFSKSEKLLQAKEKSSKLKLSGENDDMYIEQLNKRIERDEELDVVAEDDEDHRRNGKKTKTSLLEEVQREQPSHQATKCNRMTTVFDMVYQLSRHLVFHVNWEFRHGALLVFRAISRKFGQLLSLSANRKTPNEFSIERDEQFRVTRINNKTMAEVAVLVNEDIKQKCVVLLALDRFSDFLNDKSSMTHRALAAEILVTLFGNVPRLEEYYFVFEFLFLPSRKQDWEPKQAFIFLLKKLLEKDSGLAGTVQSDAGESGMAIERPFADSPVTQKVLKRKLVESLSDTITDIMLEHEEITEVATQYGTALVESEHHQVYSKNAVTFQSKLVLKLRELDDIGYLPKVIFEHFSVLLKKGMLMPMVLESLEEFLRKFLFHDNSDVRLEIFQFIATLLEKALDRLTPSNLRFIYVAMVFRFVFYKDQVIQGDCAEQVLLGELNNVVSVLQLILQKAKDKGLAIELMSLLFTILETQDFKAVVQSVGVGFSYNIERVFQLSHYDILQLMVSLFAVCSQQELKQLYAHLEPTVARNTLVHAAFLFNESSASLVPPHIQDSLIDLEFKDLRLTHLSQNIDYAVKELDRFLCEEVNGLDFEELPELEGVVGDILTITEDHESLKTNFGQLHANLIKLDKEILKLMEAGKVPFTKSNLVMIIERKLVPMFKKLLDFSTECILLMKSAAAVAYLGKSCREESIEASKINKVMYPLLSVMSRQLPAFVSKLMCEAMYKLIRIYRQEERHPNHKIIVNLLKRAAESAVFGGNLKAYMDCIFESFGFMALDKFPSLEQLMTNQSLCGLFLDCFVGVKLPDDSLAFFDRLLKGLQEGLFDKECFDSVVSRLFETLSANLNSHNAGQMNSFLTWLLDEMKARLLRPFRALKSLFDLSKRAFIPYARVFLKETIRSVTAAFAEDKSIVYEVFSTMLTLSHLDSSEGKVSWLSERLRKLETKGRRFLLEFKDPSNFEVDLRPVYCSNATSFLLRDYQAEGVRWMAFLFKYGLSCCLCDDMGLGKTLQSLSAVALQHLKSKQDRISPQRPVSLVVCPNSLISHWHNECKAFIESTVLKPRHLMPGDLSDDFDFEEFASRVPDADLYITSYNTLLRLKKPIAYTFKTVVLDEAHLIKNPRNRTSQVVKQLKSELRLALTGTPIQNKVTELWSVFDFLMPSYLGTNEQFNSEFKSLLEMSLLTVDLSKMHLSEKQQAILTNLHRKVLPFIMRREKTEVLRELPDKIIQDFNCEMTDEQAEVYKHLELKLQPKDSQRADADSEEAKTSFFAVLAEVRRLLNHPSLVENKKTKNEKAKRRIPKPKKTENSPGVVEADDNNVQSVSLGKRGEVGSFNGEHPRITAAFTSFAASGKFVALRELLFNLNYSEEDPSACLKNQNKLLVFTRSNETLQLLQEFFDKVFTFVRVLSLSKSQTPFQRADVVDLFNRNEEFKVLLLTPKIGGLGLNLSSANVVIMFDHDFNPMNDLQAMDRAHRIGQKNTVNVYRLITMRTIEEQIMGIQKFKLSVARTVINADNASIRNIQDSNFLRLIDDFAVENVKKEETPEEQVLKTFASISKHLKDTDLEEMWDENEYDREYLE